MIENSESKNKLIQKHIRLAPNNILFLDEYIVQHDTVSNYSEAVREILNDFELNDNKEKRKLNAIGKDVSIILTMLKDNDEAKYLEAKKQVETEIKKSITKKANDTVPKKKEEKMETKSKSEPDKLDFSFLGIGK
ncbi:hypothetical protein [Bombilactobacillus bombi]|uniref:hypothetical protein n=1 Tax=Bombilactobacillus bombi TaxID=1303590 RepID=UPI0035ED7C0F